MKWIGYFNLWITGIVCEGCYIWPERNAKLGEDDWLEEKK
jgi:hypothetical protein